MLRTVPIALFILRYLTKLNRAILAGVPQDSVQGPTPYTLHTSDFQIPEAISTIA